MDMVCERDGKWIGVLPKWDLEYDSGDTYSMSLSIPSSRAYAVDGTRCPWYGDLVMIPGTEIGGVIDSVTIDTTSTDPSLKFEGRTWRGMLKSSIVRPDKGQDYLIVSGTAEECVSSIISRQGLGDVFEVSGSSGISIDRYQFARYVDAHDGLTAMLKSVGLRMGISKTKGKCVITCIPVQSIDKGVDENFVKYAMSINKRPVNHLVCLGEGELKDRVVVDLYADASGKVSQSQTFTGIDEVAEVYDSNNEDAEGITEAGTKRLEEMQTDSVSVDLSLPEDMDAELGDAVSCRSVDFGLEATSEIARIVVKMSDADKVIRKDFTAGSVKLR